eukprot:7334052-Prymnesium_polylepis.1
MRAFTLTPCRRCPGLAASALGPCEERNVSDPSVLSGAGLPTEPQQRPAEDRHMRPHCASVRPYFYGRNMFEICMPGREHTQTQLLSQLSVLKRASTALRLDSTVLTARRHRQRT